MHIRFITFLFLLLLLNACDSNSEEEPEVELREVTLQDISGDDRTQGFRFDSGEVVDLPEDSRDSTQTPVDFVVDIQLDERGDVVGPFLKVPLVQGRTEWIFRFVSQHDLEDIARDQFLELNTVPPADSIFFVDNMQGGAIWTVEALDGRVAKMLILNVEGEGSADTIRRVELIFAWDFLP